MSTLEFISSLVDSLAWPVAAVVLLILLRKPVTELIPRLASLKYRDLELSFSQELRSAAEEADRLLPPETLVRSAPAPEPISGEEPAMSIVKSWQRVVDALQDRAESQAATLAPAVRTMPLVLSALLLSDGHISQAQYDLITRLSSLRNRAIHADQGEITDRDATEYAGLVERLVTSFEH